jgi:short-subunit dehydrogenase
MAKQRKALITGASEGIGRAFAERLTDEGYAVTAVARNEKRLKELMEDLDSNACAYKKADLSTQEGTEEIYKELTANHYNLLINNAGFGVYGEFYKTNLDKLKNMTRLNCDALVDLSHAFLKKSKRGDALINVSSALAFMPTPSAGLYAATKAFVTSFSESLWYEHKERGVYVMGLCPGVTSSQFHQRAGGSEKNRPPGVITQTPEQVVDVAMKALKKRSSPTIVSGYTNSLATNLVRLLPRKHLVSMMSNLG